MSTDPDEVVLSVRRYSGTLFLALLLGATLAFIVTSFAFQRELATSRATIVLLESQVSLMDASK